MCRLLFLNELASYQEIKEATKLYLLGSCILFYIDAACSSLVYLSELKANFDSVYRIYLKSADCSEDQH